jgi:hypothetical protein
VARDGGHFLIAKAGLDETGDGFMTQVVEAQVGDFCIPDDLFPGCVYPNSSGHFRAA